MEGRKRSNIWNNKFERIKLPDGRLKSRCEICEQTWSGAQPKRLLQHRLICGNKLELSDAEEPRPKRPRPTLKPVWVSSERFIGDSSSDSSSSSDRNPIKVRSPVRSTRQLNTRLNTLPIIAKVSNEETQILDDLFGMFVFSQPEPYKVAESLHLKAFLKALHPDYEIPSIVELRTFILNRIKAKVSSMIPIAANVFEEAELDDFKSKLN